MLLASILSNFFIKRNGVSGSISNLPLSDMFSYVYKPITLDKTVQYHWISLKYETRLNDVSGDLAQNILLQYQL
jgi:hypothetical protein